MVGVDDRPRRGGGGCVRADNREIDDGEQGGGGRFCRHGAPTTVDKEVFSPWLPCRCLPNILPHKCIECAGEKMNLPGKNGNWLAVNGIIAPISRNGEVEEGQIRCIAMCFHIEGGDKSGLLQRRGGNNLGGVQRFCR